MGDTFSLTQKYRPNTFKDVLDQKAIITVLKNLLKNKKYSSPLMFTGIYGGGKTTLARIFARAVLCKDLTESFEPCNKCSSCKAFMEDANPAYNEIDAASNSGVEDIRKLREEANFKVLGDYDHKVVVIDECHSISAKGNDALLKQLEDNSTEQVYLFCTTAPEKMHKTVRSRCLEFNLNRNSKTSIEERLRYICSKENFEFEEKGISIIASMTTPHVRDSLKTLEYLSNFGSISEEVASKHYKLMLENKYLNLVASLKSNLNESIKILETLTMQETVPNIYEGLVRNSINILKLKNGINNFRTDDQKRIALEINKIYGEDLTKVLESLLKRNKYVDQLTLESDIIILNKKLGTTFSEETYVETVYVEVPSNKKDTSSEVPQKAEPTESSPPQEEIKTSSDQDEGSAKEENLDDLDATEAIFKRYPTYPPHLAMMMAKSKKNNSSLTDDATVELKNRAKDVKKSLPRSEIRDFIDNRNKRM